LVRLIIRLQLLNQMSRIKRFAALESVKQIITEEADKLRLAKEQMTVSLESINAVTFSGYLNELQLKFLISAASTSNSTNEAVERVKVLLEQLLAGQNVGQTATVVYVWISL
jgi:hypothetical protein